MSELKSKIWLWEEHITYIRNYIISASLMK